MGKNWQKIKGLGEGLRSNLEMEVEKLKKSLIFLRWHAPAVLMFPEFISNIMNSADLDFKTNACVLINKYDDMSYNMHCKVERIKFYILYIVLFCFANMK